MTEKRLKTYEKLLGYVLFLAVIRGIVSQLTGCGESWKEESRIVIDYRFTEAHEEERVGYKKEYNAFAETWVDVPYKYKTFIPDRYELLWEVTYQDGHTERHWEECTRFEYNNARKELGDLDDGND